MLTNLQYNNLWVTPFPHGFNKGIVHIPNYHDYIDRENMFEDYLDIFRGINTRGARVHVPIGGWYYDHPFFDAHGQLIPQIKTDLKIKYILIGEACPDDGNNYFYDIREINTSGQGYLIPIYKATYGGLVPVKPWTPLSTINDKIEKLIDIANRGVLLIDLFPFAIKYTTALRKTLARHNVTADFFDNIANPYNINARLIGLIGLKTKPQIALVAPPKISHDIANRINIGGIAIALGFTIRAVHNFVTPPIMLIIKDEFYIWPPGTHLSGLYPWRVKPKMFPIFRCCCYSGAKTVPHQLFITNAFI